MKLTKQEIVTLIEEVLNEGIVGAGLHDLVAGAQGK